MLFYGIGSACEAIGGANGWNEALYRTWYLTGAVWTAGWLGLGTAFLLGRTRFGYSFALCLFLAGLFTFLVRNKPEYAGAGTLPLLYLIAAAILALAVAVETYFQNDRWPMLAVGAVVGATVLSIVLMAVATLPAPGYALDPATGVPVATLLPPQLRLLTPFMNITGAFALILGAVFSAYVFMPKRRVLAYSLDPNQPGDEFLFNLLIAPVAITVNLVASLPGALRALVTGRIHSRVPATILIAIGALVAATGDILSRFGVTGLFQSGQVRGRDLPLRRVPGLDRRVPRVPDPVHLDRPRPGPARVAGRGGAGGGQRVRAGTGRRPSPRLTARVAGPRPAGGGPSAYHGRMSPPPAAGTAVSRPAAPAATVSAPVGMAIVIGSAALFGMLGPLSRFAYDAGMEPPAFVVWRALVGLVATAAFVAWRVRRGDITLARWSTLPGSARRLLLLAALMGFTLNLAMFIAFDRITVALALLGFYTYPAMVALANAALGRDRLDRRRVVALALALAGMVAVVASQLDPAAGIRFDALGFGLALGAALSQTVFVVVSRDGYPTVPTEQAMTVVLGVTVVGATVVSLLMGHAASLVEPVRSPSILPLLLFTGVFAAAIPSMGFLAGIRAIGGRGRAS